MPETPAAPIGAEQPVAVTENPDGSSPQPVAVPMTIAKQVWVRTRRAGEAALSGSAIVTGLAVALASGHPPTLAALKSLVLFVVGTMVTAAIRNYYELSNGIDQTSPEKRA